ncbi:hypothetical protein EW093_07915 [Thiospirochaeta perfilievii]|uniref:Uncharacterized protein n=1 Tax=Thiospirochaeta perfilievii TaxID=252967 RepID=A0A5C1QAT8_9SPIO|nr:hypothetical protein [Thiospirochaeta perfilievii]QEN04631.1 hypothetical protein EW093_07915 [Thiospirochaeta perfilievii]
MVKKVLFVLIFTTVFTLFSEVDIDASLNGVLGVTRDNSGDFTSSSLASGSLTIKSTNSSDVKSQLTLDFLSYRSVGTLSISKAWIKFRFPLFRVTLGKNRITWGEGAAFNAGDVIFDDYIDPIKQNLEEVDLTADELRSVNRTLAQVIFPLGRFTYTELIYLPYDFLSTDDLSVIATGATPVEKGFESHSYGGRFVTRLGGIKLETGYIYNGDRGVHKPYISINGTSGVDYHLSSSINIQNGNSDFDLWKESLKISSGAFYIFDFEDDKTLTLRLESQIKPFGDWELDALELYPELSLVPNDEISLFLRGIINPLDFTLKSTFGLNWKTYQGFSIGSFISSNITSNNYMDTKLTVSVTHKF